MPRSMAVPASDPNGAALQENETRDPRFRGSRAPEPCEVLRTVSYGEIAHAVHVPFELVARLDGAHARWRSGEDEVARLQRDEIREVVDLLGHAPDLHGQVSL